MLWYPGRVPLCTPQVIQGLEHYIAALDMAVLRQDPTHIETAERIHRDIHAVLYAEGLDCLGSDTDINALLNLLLQAQEAARVCAKHQRWDDLNDVVIAVDLVRHNLTLKQEQGGLDGGETCSASTTDTDESTGRWTDGSTCSGEEDGT